MITRFFFILTTLVWFQAWGQAEVILLNQNTSGAQSDSRAAPDTSGSGRYTVKPRPATKPKPSPTPFPAPQIKSEAESAKKETETEKNLEQATTLPMVAPVPAEKVEEENILVRARDALMGGSPEILDEYRSYMQPDDIRRNIIEIRLAPSIIYNDSQSPSYSRSYNGFTPGLYFSNDIWFTMFFGLNTTYRVSLNGSVPNNPQNSSFVSASHEWASVGLRFRRFYGFGKNSPALEFGVDLREYQYRVPTDDPNRVRLKSTGAFLNVEAKIPSSSRYSSTYSFGLSPWLTHSEANAGTAALSGIQNTTFVLNAGLGGEYKLERTSRIFWKLDYELQRSLFDGSARGADRITGATLNNVPVNNGFLIFNFGYTWAK